MTVSIVALEPRWCPFQPICCQHLSVVSRAEKDEGEEMEGKMRAGEQWWRGWRETERGHTSLSLTVLIWIITAENNALTVSGNELF